MNQQLMEQTYINNPLLADLNKKLRFPILQSFATLALLSISTNNNSNNNNEIAKLVVQELFYYTFLTPAAPPSIVPQPNHPSLWIPYLRSEASQQVNSSINNRLN